MEPVAAAAMVMMAGVLVVAVAIGALGGAVTALLRAELAWGAIAVVAAHLAVLPLLGIRSMSLAGLFPLILTFLVAAGTTHQLQARSRIGRPWGALIGFIAGIFVGFCYLMLIRLGIWPLFDRGSAWAAVGVTLGLIVASLWKRRRSMKGVRGT